MLLLLNSWFSFPCCCWGRKCEHYITLDTTCQDIICDRWNEWMINGKICKRALLQTWCWSRNRTKELWWKSWVTESLRVSSVCAIKGVPLERRQIQRYTRVLPPCGGDGICRTRLSWVCAGDWIGWVSHHCKHLIWVTTAGSVVTLRSLINGCLTC